MTRVDAVGDSASVSGHTSTTTAAGSGNFSELLLRAVPGQYNVTIMTPYTLSSLAPLSVSVQVGCQRCHSGDVCQPIVCMLESDERGFVLPSQVVEETKLVDLGWCRFRP